ncbi:hypothetical protein [Acaryochloris marina]|uniref:Uncharacterized protein n=1 Tax=Acaryochloris marina (strain MBIC 11017) TaxID=329726 RepID=B0CB81_ACAM1|nr:hypothetical protein [Acaryochloris marina]ABW26720.1 hypothetical protein AM1_1699 [Acaryochloris marina MBIC11017]BDM81500.1 hypothetical protein AM10699_43670 [Acaryochloris marina MBIC10699]
MKDVTAQTNAIADCLKTLEQVSAMVHGLTEQANPLTEALDMAQFNRGVGKALTHLFELEADLYDLEPDYTPEHRRPSLAPINLGAVLNYLSTPNKPAQYSAQRQLASHMTDVVAAEFTEACAQGQGLEFAQKWWESQNKPFIPVIQTYRDLHHARKYVRYHSAALLGDIFNITLWDDGSQEVLLNDAQDWFTQWLQTQA